MTLEERAAVLPELEPEMATFNTGSFNFGLFPIAERGGEFEDWEVDYLEGTRDYIFRNTFADMEKVCAMFRESGAKPELEAYDVGHLYNIKYLLSRGLLDTPVHVQDRKSTRLNSSHANISYAVFCLKKKISNAFFC